MVSIGRNCGSLPALQTCEYTKTPKARWHPV
jgi:hypothetical protein